jgi:hypothetical protein
VRSGGLIYVRPVLGLLLTVICLQAQDIPSNRLTLSAGWTRQIGGSSFADKQTAPGLGLSIGHRFHKFIEPEVGLFTALDPTGDICGRFGCVDVSDHFFWIPFGVRFVAPLYLGRIEFSGGGGGLFEKYTVGNETSGGGPSERDGWGGYFVGSAALSLDRGRHFWLAATPRWFLANPAYARDRWFQIAAEFEVRFK